jgi:hypothetical protein
VTAVSARQQRHAYSVIPNSITGRTVSMATEKDAERRARQGSAELPADCHPDIRAIVTYWRAIHPDTGLPGRQHFDPLDIPKLLPRIRILDVVGDPPRFKTRLLGTKIAEGTGFDYTGRYLDEVYPEFASSAAAHGLSAVLRTGELHWRRGNPALVRGKELMTIERVYLPFARDGRKIDMILTCLLFGDCSGKMY